MQKLKYSERCCKVIKITAFTCLLNTLLTIQLIAGESDTTSKISIDAHPGDKWHKIIWKDNFKSKAQVLCLDNVNFSDNGATLLFEDIEKGVSLEGIEGKDTSQVKRQDGWKGSFSPAGGKLIYRFTGTSFFGICQKSSSSGILDVKIDGQKVGEINLFGKRMANITFADGLKNELHTGELIVSGRKDKESSGTAVKVYSIGYRVTGFPHTGSIISTPIICAQASSFQWEKINYSIDTPAGTAIRIDILDCNDNVILSDVPNNAQLTSLNANIIKLKATLSTIDSRITPSLKNWELSYWTTQKAKGNISGVVVDPNGKSIAGVTVIALQDGMEKKKVETGADGEYIFDKLPEGQYDLHFSKPGFLQSETKAIPAETAIPENRILYPVASLNGKKLTIAVANVMRKMFRDDLIESTAIVPEVNIEAARNEYEPCQIAIRGIETLSGVSIEIGNLVHESGNYIIPKHDVKINFVGYVPVWRNSQDTPAKELASLAPRDFPDPLLKDKVINISKGTTQPVWITVKIPQDALTGKYISEVKVHTSYGIISIPFRLQVYDVTLPAEPHILTGMAGCGWERIARHNGNNSINTDGFWKSVRMCLKNMSEHRMNKYFPEGTTVSNTRIIARRDGSLHYDFSLLDKWIETILDTSPYGRDKIMIEFYGPTFRKEWNAKDIFFAGCTVYNEDGTKCKEKSLGQVSTDSEEFKNFAVPFFGALQAHLEDKGWLEFTWTRLHDEPLGNSDAYKRLSELVHKAAPKLKRYEAIRTTGLAGYIDMQCPSLDVLDQNIGYFRASHDMGGKVLFYTCWDPRGQYPNQFIDFPLMKTRIQEWIVYYYQLDGYDRYGWGVWVDGDPYKKTGKLAPGDDYCVYPDPEKKSVINSLRWEMMREGIEDYEYLWLLADTGHMTAKTLGARDEEFDPISLAMEFCARAVSSGTKYERDPDTLMQLRHDIIEAIVSMKTSPLIVLKTEKTSNGVKVSGVLEEHSSIRINGSNIPIDSNRRFNTVIPSCDEITVVARKGNLCKTIVKKFSSGSWKCMFIK